MNKIKGMAIGFLLCFTLLGIPYLSSLGVFQPNPYRVTSSSFELSEDEASITFKANFWKDGCVFNRLEVVGIYFGVADFLEFVDVNKLKQKERLDNLVTAFGEDSNEVKAELSLQRELGDRLKGFHSMELLIAPLDKPYGEIEVRTRHICGDKGEEVLIDKVFAKGTIDHYR